MIRFENDDRTYLAWLRHHPAGHVLNVRARPDPNYVVLHRATCGFISSDSHEANAYTGGGYRKICSTDLDDLGRAAVAEGRADRTFSRRCSHCCR